MTLARKKSPAPVEQDDLELESTPGNTISHDDEDDFQEDVQEELSQIALPFSKKLLAKLKQVAEEEGITKEQLACEFISEGLAARVWQVFNPQKPHVGGQPNQNSGGHNNQQRNFNNNNRNFRNNRQQRGHNNNMNLMQDKAAFMEYVRSQERKRQR